MVRWVLPLALVALSACAAPELLVSQSRPGIVVRVRESDGRVRWRDNAGGDVDEVLGIRRGPKRQLYLCSYRTHKILAFRETWQTEEGEFAGPDVIQGPTDLLFLPDGNVLVACTGSTQHLLDETFNAAGVQFVILGGPKSDRPGEKIAVVDKGNYAGVPTCLAFGPDGHVYVGGRDTSTILRIELGDTPRVSAAFDTGETLKRGPMHIAFGPDGALYATSIFDTKVVRVDQEGAKTWVDDPQLVKPTGLAFSKKGDLLFVASYYRGEIRTYDAGSGAYLETLADEMPQPWAVIPR